MAVVSLLYSHDLGNENTKEHTDEILEEKKIRNRQKEFAYTLYDGTIASLERVDTAIKKHLKEWEFDRLGSIERAVMRLAAYEIFLAELDPAVVINEAVEISKAFASEQSPKFINGVLDAISKDKTL